MSNIKGASLSRNAILATGQALVSGIALFLLYRFLLTTIGSEQVGIWALVLSTASASRISELGFSASAVKFIAKYLSVDDVLTAAEVVRTTVITVGAVLGIILLLCFPLLKMLIGAILPGNERSLALEILPLALFSVWIGALANVFQSALDGCQRADKRVVIVLISAVIFLILVWVLVPIRGLEGLAIAQIYQNLILLLGCRLMLQRDLPNITIFTLKWRRDIFREMFRYGANFQITSVAAMLFEPTTKALMANFGGLTSTAYYEMANRMVVQFRSLLVAANQVVVPRISAAYENSPGTISQIYQQTYGLIFFLSVPFFTTIAVAAPLASLVWIGYIQQEFVWFSIMFCIGYSVNTLSAPAYFINLGTGHLRWNTVSHIVIGCLNFIVGFYLGNKIGANGVLFGYIFALIFGSGITITAYLQQNKMASRTIFPVHSGYLVGSCFVGAFSAWLFFIYSQNYMDERYRASLCVAVLLLVIAPSVLRHPMRPLLEMKLRSL